MRRTRLLQIVAACALAVGMVAVGPRSAEAGDYSWHHGWKAFLRYGVLYGYPGARYGAGCGQMWGACPYYGFRGPEHLVSHGSGPWCCGAFCGPNCAPLPPIGYGYGGVNVDHINSGVMPGGGYNMMPGAPGPGVPPNALLLDVRVPPDAVVKVNGQATKARGEQRLFTAKGLNEGASYGYEVTAEANIGGRMVTNTQQIVARTGQVEVVVFDFNGNESEQVPSPAASEARAQRSTLTLHVPDAARVYVDGHAMRSTGSTRTFGTTVPAGRSNSVNYQVRVEIDRDGTTLVHEQSVALVAGGHREVNVDLGVMQASHSQASQR